MRKIKVLIVDDSKLIQELLTFVLNKDSEIEVVGVASNPNIARQKIKVSNPDVLILDIEMPEMNGIEFVEKIMRLHPMPVIMFSAVTQSNSEAAIESLELGAFDFVPKPDNPMQFDLFASSLIAKVKTAFQGNILCKSNKSNVNKPLMVFEKKGEPIDLILIGSSTGGIEALTEIVRNLPEQIPPIVLCQHLPKSFLDSFISYFKNISRLPIVKAEDGRVLENNHIYVLEPSSKTAILGAKGSLSYTFKVTNNDNNHSSIDTIDYLFESAALLRKTKILAFILTGMGSDGANGMLSLKANGAITVAQDKETSVVWGMPKSAIDKKAIDMVLSVYDIPNLINQVSKRDSGGHYV